MKANANDAGALREKGEILIARKQFANAEPLIRRASVLLPDDPQTKLSLAEVLLHDHKLVDARHYAEQAVGSGLGDVHAHRVLAEIYRRQGLAKKMAAEDAEADRLAAALNPGPSSRGPGAGFSIAGSWQRPDDSFGGLPRQEPCGACLWQL